MNGTMRILVVEDDLNSRESLTILLRDEGHTVDAVGAGAKALAHLERDRYDILLTDLVMPGMSGLELIRTARRAAPDLRCFVMSGQSPTDEPDVVWISKPIDIDHLLVSLSSVR